MTAIIRPAPSVFRKTLPMMVVVGAFRPLGDDQLLDCPTADMMRSVLETARSYRWPLAFWRQHTKEEVPPDGHWLPGCRPRVMDRVFEGRSASMFDNREFCSVVARSQTERLYAVGPRNDSTLLASQKDAPLFGCSFVLVSDHEVLHFCSGGQSDGSDGECDGAPHPTDARICVRNWKDTLRTVEFNE